MAQQSTQQAVQQSEVVRRVSLPAHLRIICRGRREDENGGWDVYGTSPSGQALDPIEGLSFEEIDEILLGNFVPFLGDHGELVEMDGRRYGFRIFTLSIPFRGFVLSDGPARRLARAHPGLPLLARARSPGNRR